MNWLDLLRSPYRQEADDGMGGFKYGPFYQLWMQRQQQAQQPWQGKNPGHIGTPWVGGPGPDVPTPWMGQPQMPGPDVPTPWTGQQPQQKPPMQIQPMSQRRPPVSGVIRR